MRKISGILIIWVLGFGSVYAQSSLVDSLTSLLKSDIADTTRVNVLNELAFQYIYINPQIAKDDVAIAYRQANALKYKKGIARSFTVLGGIDWAQGNYAEALDNYFKALDHYEKTGDFIGSARCYNNIGEVYKRIGNLTKSLEYHIKSLKIKQELLAPRYTFTSMVNIAELYVEMDRLEEGRTHYQVILENRDVATSRQVAYALKGLGQIELMKKKFVEALGYFNEVEQLREQINDQRGLADIYYNKSLAFLHLKSFDSADHYLSNAIEKAKSIGAKDILANSYLHLAYLDSTNNNFHNAFNNYLSYSRIKDSVFNEDMLSQIAQVQTAYETALLQKENESNSIKVKQQNTFIIGVVMMMFFTIAIAWTFYRQQKNQQKVNYLLAGKNEEISRKNDEIQSQSKKLMMLNQKLEKLNEGLEGKVKERTQILIEQNKKLAEYAYTNAHELRAPVANILGLVNLLTYSSDLTVKEKEIVNHLKKSTSELDGVIRNIRKRLEQEDESPLGTDDPEFNNLPV